MKQFTNENRIKTVTQLRASFWDAHPDLKQFYRKTWKQNRYHCDIRVSWVMYVDSMQKDGLISSQLANRATL